jgi:hypothetical protein
MPWTSIAGSAMAPLLSSGSRVAGSSDSGSKRGRVPAGSGGRVRGSGRSMRFSVS